MEKFAVGVGLLVAACLVTGSLIHFENGFHFDVDSSAAAPGRQPPAGAVDLAPGAVRTFQGSELVLQDAVAVLRVIPEERSDIAVSVRSGGAALPAFKIGQDGTRVVLDGDLDGRIRGCSDMNGVQSFRIDRMDAIRASDAPVITVRAPLDAKISVSGAVNSQLGAARSLTFDSAGCGDAQIGRVEQSLSMDVRGSGNAKAEEVGSADIDIAGSGGVQLGAVRGPLKSVVRGSGSFSSGPVTGDTKLEVAGSGDINTAAVTGRLEARVAGSGDLQVESVTGPTEVSLAGSGDLSIKGGRAQGLKARIAGSGDVAFEGVVEGDLEVSIAGSGDVRVRQVTGAVNKSVAGSGEVIIG